MSWPTKTMLEIAKIASGGTPSRDNREYFTGEIIWLKSGELNDNPNINDSEEHISEQALKDSNAKIFPSGTVLLAMYGATAGKLGILNAPAATNQAIAGIIVDKKQVHNKYLYCYLLHFRENLIAQAWGGAQPNISQGIIKGLSIPLPPIEEQMRIVEKIEKLFAKIDEVVALRRSALGASAALLPSALHHVFSRAEKEGWGIQSVGEICEKPQYGYTASAKQDKVGPKLLRITDIQNGEVDWDSVPYCKCSNVDKYQLENGDIVFARTGATVGKSFLIKSAPKNSVFASYLIRLRPNADVLSEFLYAFFQSPDYWQQIVGHQVGAAQPNVNASKLAKIKMPLPPLSEQKKIVAYLDSLSSKSRQLQELQNQTAEDLSALRQSILHQAFNASN
jgi:type I restriction enzyme S subunit